MTNKRNDALIMNTGLPKGWKVVKLSDVCKNITDGSHFSPKSQEDGYSYVTVRDVDNDQIDFDNCKKISKQEYKKLVENGCRPYINDLLFSKDGTVGKVTLVNYEKEFVVLSSLAIFTPDVSIISPKYLFFVLKSDQFVRQALNQKKGVAIRRIILRDLKELKLNLTSIPEQHRIVAKLEELLSELEKGKEQLHIALDQLKVYRQAVLKYAFEGKLTNKNVKDGELPKGWKWVKVSDVVDMQSGVAFKKSEYSKSGIRLFQIANVSFNYIKWEEIEHLPESYSRQYPELLLNVGDIVMALNRPMLNDQLKIAEIRSSDTPAILYQRVGRFIFQKGDNKKYFLYFLQSPQFVKWLKEQLRGVNIPFINKSRLLGYDRYPICSVNDQHRIVEEIESRLSVVDKLEETITASVQQSETLRQSILKKAFEGKLV